MNKRFSSFVCFMLSVLLLLSSVPLSAQAAEMTHEEAYDEYVELLNLYMEASPDASVNIAQLKENFFSMGSYKCSAEFWLYAEVMFHLEENNFSEAMNYATILESYSSDQSAFDLLLKDDDFSSRYAAIRPVSEMMEYIRGRKEEYINNNTTASNHYSECLKFYDARTRYQRLRPNLDTLYDEGLACIRNGDFAKALEIAKSLQERGYEKGDSLYNVAKSRLDMANATPVPTAEPTSAPTPIPTAKPVATTKPTAKPTATPTPKPQWSAWSEWSATNPGSNTSTREVQQKTQYRYRTSSTTQQWSAWSGWSGWSETAVSETDSRDVETKQETKTTTTYKYKYSRWLYTRTDGATGSSYSEYYGSYYKSNGRWQTKTTTSPLNKAGTSNGHQRYNSTTDAWWNEEKIPVNSSTTVTMYRYRTRTKQNVTTWGGYTAWQDERVSSSSTCEVQTRTVYRYRTLK